MQFNLLFDFENRDIEKKCFDNLLKEYESKEVGFYYLVDEEFKNIKTEYEEIVVVGIGGSSLGTKMIYQLFQDKLKKMIFLENPDPIDIELKTSNLKNPIFFVISKSGKTIETLSIFKYLIKKFNLQKNAKNLKIITDKNSPLDKFANEWNLERFFIPKNVGGRFSVLSSVGMVPLSLAGLDVNKILKGAKEFRDNFFNKKEWHLVKKASFYATNYKKYHINVLFAYSTLLTSFKEWFVQLFGESLGKDSKEIMPVGHIGSIDQHSFLQLLMEGMQNKTITFLKIDDFNIDLIIPDIKLPFLEDTDFVNGYKFSDLINKEEESTKEALLAKGYFVDEIVLSLKEENIGKLIIYYEILTSAIGNLMEINPYNQPGVEIGKVILKNKF